MTASSAILVGIFLSLTQVSSCFASSSPDAHIPGLLEFTDDASRALGIGILRDAKLPTGAQEIRLWTGFGSVIPHRMASITVTPSGKVSGSIYLWYQKTDHPSSSERRELHKYLKDEWGCTRYAVYGEDEACRSALRPTISWQRLLRSLETIGLRRLPDESVLPKPDLQVFDGYSIVVEIRHGLDYHAYGYSNPWARSEPEAKAAAEIMRVLNEALSPGT